MMVYRLCWAVEHPPPLDGPVDCLPRLASGADLGAHGPSCDRVMAMLTQALAASDTLGVDAQG